MMKKVLLVCVLVVALAGSASALPTYIWTAGGYTAAGTDGSSVTVGAMASPGTAPANPLASQAAVASLAYTGALGESMTKTALYNKNWVAVPGPDSWILQAWAGTTFAGDTLSIRVWANTAASTVPAAGWSLYKLYDPITMEWGKTLLGEVPIGAVNGSIASPWLKVDVPVFKTGTPLAAGQGYILELTTVPIPEPGSMVAMLSGLVGLVGFGIRRRR